MSPCKSAPCERLAGHRGMHVDGDRYWDDEPVKDDLDVFCRADPTRAAQALRDANQERQDHYSREARLMERIEDLERERAAEPPGQTPVAGREGR